jgi:hypothetical protein
MRIDWLAENPTVACAVVDATEPSVPSRVLASQQSQRPVTRYMAIECTRAELALRPDRGIAATQAFFRKALASHPDRTGTEVQSVLEKLARPHRNDRHNAVTLPAPACGWPASQ